jgi:hypothetical protein
MSARRVALVTDQIYEGLFDDVFLDLSTRQFQYERIYESQSNITKAPLAPNTQLLFTMSNSARYFLPAQSYLYIQARVGDIQAGAAYPAPALANVSTVALQNNLPLFVSGSYSINGVPVEQQPQFMPTTHLQRNLLEYSDDDGNSFQDECWIRDKGTAGGVDSRPSIAASVNVVGQGPPVTVVTTTTTVVNPTFNSGYLARQNIITTPGVNTSKTFTLRIPLWRLFGFLTKDVVYTGAEHRLNLTINQNLNQLFIQANGDATVPQMEVKNIFWECPYVDPSPETRALILNKMVERKSSSFMFPYSTSFQYVNQAASPSLQWQVSTLTERPYMAAVSFQSQARYANANGQLNCQIFDTQDISNIYISWGGKQYPAYQYSPSLTAGYGMGEAYATYLQLTNRYFDVEGGASISFADFQNLYNIYLFDLRYTDEDQSPFAAGQNSQLMVSAKFNTNLPANYYVWCTVWSEREAKTVFADGKTLLTTQ